MAIYNSGYPATYQNPYMIQQPPYSQPIQQHNGIIWIQGEAAAKSYLVAPNTSVALWDSESQTVYIKSADASGMPSMKILDYTIRDGVQAQPAPAGAVTDYATRADLDALKGQIDSLKMRLGKLTKREAEGNE